MYRNITLKVFSFLCLFVMVACSQTDSDNGFSVDEIVPADALYNQALANLDAGDLNTAQDRIDELNRQHPYSEYSRRSIILDTFINYRPGKYTEAVVRLYRGNLAQWRQRTPTWALFTGLFLPWSLPE